ncbi:hypothetical protein QFC21_005738 [Naganishia friedmannii]|uniref:Uncharacterized protein n=1 Tax=Naganishia friedmannii TaxID=89922 RepID=A0ACC2V8F4_9TREE|nr:hypothetical protein QFC21_005738 [Naganishia friedmannii]
MQNSTSNAGTPIAVDPSSASASAGAGAGAGSTISAGPQPSAAAPSPGAGAGMMSPPGGVAAYGTPQQQQMMAGGAYAGGQGQGQGTMQEQQRRAHLYVGNLSPRVTEYMLTEIFAVAGPVANAKIIPDRNFTHGGLNFGFVEYTDMRSAEQALGTLNGRKIFDTEIRVNWAYQNQNQQGGGAGGLGPGGGPAGVAGGQREDTQNHYHVFVGDLSPEVNDEALGKAFGAFGTMSEARVMWDMNSGKSRGYGFLAFREKADAEQAIATMNGEWLGSRAIRVNWANQKTQTGGRGGPGGFGGGGSSSGGGGGGGPSYGGGMGMGMGMSGLPAAPAAYGSAGMMGMSAGGGGGYSAGGVAAAGNDYETVVAQTPAYNTTVYVGNLIPYSTQADLIPLFQGYGYIVEIRMQADRGFAFVKLDTHEHAAQAICNLQNYQVHGRPIKCSWGKDREGGATAAGGGAPGVASPVGMGGMQQPGAMNMGMMGYNPMVRYPFEVIVGPSDANLVPSPLAQMQQQMYGMPPQTYAQYYPGYADPSAVVAGATPDPSSASGQPGWGAAQDPAAAAAAYYAQQAQAAAAGSQWGAYYGGQAQTGQPGQQR